MLSCIAPLICAAIASRATQDQKGLLIMLQHFRWNGTVGNGMLVVLLAIQLVSGLCKPILEDVTTKIPHLGDGWFKLHRERLVAMSGIMWVERQWTPSLQRLHDAMLMKDYVGGLQ